MKKPLVAKARRATTLVATNRWVANLPGSVNRDNRLLLVYWPLRNPRTNVSTSTSASPRSAT